jgi:hypothetical protein
MSEHLAELAVGLERVSAPGQSPMAGLYAAHWEVTAPEQGTGWRVRLAAGLLAVAGHLSPDVLEQRVTIATRAASESSSPA